MKYPMKLSIDTIKKLDTIKYQEKSELTLDRLLEIIIDERIEENNSKELMIAQMKEMDRLVDIMKNKAFNPFDKIWSNPIDDSDDLDDRDAG